MSEPKPCQYCGGSGWDAGSRAPDPRMAVLIEAAKMVEEWWLQEGMKHFRGAPCCIFELRAALEAVRKGTT